jgi:hypothetical protein
MDFGVEGCGVALFLGGIVDWRSNWCDQDGRAVDL